jgi:hypothetical protein
MNIESLLRLAKTDFGQIYRQRCGQAVQKKKICFLCGNPQNHSRFFHTKREK